MNSNVECSVAILRTTPGRLARQWSPCERGRLLRIKADDVYKETLVRQWSPWKRGRLSGAGVIAYLERGRRERWNEDEEHDFVQGLGFFWSKDEDEEHDFVGGTEGRGVRERERGRNGVRCDLVWIGWVVQTLLTRGEKERGKWHVTFLPPRRHWGFQESLRCDPPLSSGPPSDPGFKSRVEV